MREKEKAAPSGNGQSIKDIVKDKMPKTELQTIFAYLQTHIATASMVSTATGIAQKNITRYKRDLEKAGKLWEIEKKACKVTGFKAMYLTTNPDWAQILIN